MFKWLPDLDIDSVQLPTLDDAFPTSAVKDALNNVKEYLISPPRALRWSPPTASVCGESPWRGGYEDGVR